MFSLVMNIFMCDNLLHQSSNDADCTRTVLLHRSENGARECVCELEPLEESHHSTDGLIFIKHADTAWLCPSILKVL